MVQKLEPNLNPKSSVARSNLFDLITTREEPSWLPSTKNVAEKYVPLYITGGPISDFDAVELAAAVSSPPSWFVGANCHSSGLCNVRPPQKPWCRG
jgi:hypothetical protein